MIHRQNPILTIENRGKRLREFSLLQMSQAAASNYSTLETPASCARGALIFFFYLFIVRATALGTSEG